MLAAALAALCLPGLAQDPKLDSGLPIPPEQACYDVRSYDLALKVDPEKKTIAGTLGMRARVVKASESILLDLDDRLTVASITRDKQKIDFVREPGRIRIRGLEEFAEAEERIASRMRQLLAEESELLEGRAGAGADTFPEPSSSTA